MNIELNWQTESVGLSNNFKNKPTYDSRRISFISNTAFISAGPVIAHRDKNINSHGIHENVTGSMKKDVVGKRSVLNV